MNDETRRQTKDFNGLDLVFLCSSLSFMKLVKALSLMFSSTKRQLEMLQKYILYAHDNYSSYMIGIFLKSSQLIPTNLCEVLIMNQRETD